MDEGAARPDGDHADGRGARRRDDRHGLRLRRRPNADRQAEPASASEVEPTATPTPSAPVETPTPTTAPTPTEPPAPEFVLAQGDEGEQVRELQHRLFQLAWWPELTTGRYDGATREAVARLPGQAWQRIKATGQVDDRTWTRLTSMTETPTHDEKFNVLKPGPALYAAGAGGEEVRGVQARLKQIAWLFGDVTGSYDADDRRGGARLPGQARDPGDRRGRPAHVRPAGRDDLHPDVRADAQHRARAGRAGPALHDRSRAVHRQDRRTACAG